MEFANQKPLYQKIDKITFFLSQALGPSVTFLSRRKWGREPILIPWEHPSLLWPEYLLITVINAWEMLKFTQQVEQNKKCIKNVAFSNFINW